MPRDMTVAPTEMAIPALNSAVRTWSAVTCRPLDGWHRFPPNEARTYTYLRVRGPGGASPTLGGARRGPHDKRTLMRSARADEMRPIAATGREVGASHMPIGPRMKPMKSHGAYLTRQVS